jgi:hypothetical protein
VKNQITLTCKLWIFCDTSGHFNLRFKHAICSKEVV